MTPETLALAIGCNLNQARKWAGPLTSAMEQFEINTPCRQAAFLAQVGHESCSLLFVREIWNPVQVPAQARYEGRADLGNTEPGDGVRFLGRGPIQITGRANYQACGIALGLDLLSHPELLEIPEHGASSAAWFWQSRALNQLADQGRFHSITRAINGGTNGEKDRDRRFALARKALIEAKND